MLDGVGTAVAVVVVVTDDEVVIDSECVAVVVAAVVDEAVAGCDAALAGSTLDAAADDEDGLADVAFVRSMPAFDGSTGGVRFNVDAELEQRRELIS